MTITYIIIALVLVLGSFFYFRGGSSYSSYANVTLDEFSQLMNDKNVILVDVRTQNEMNQGVIGKPLHLELGPAIQNKMMKLDKNKKYLLYCRSGRRSGLASDMMMKLGFDDVNNLVGGYNAWMQNK